MGPRYILILGGNMPRYRGAYFDGVFHSQSRGLAWEKRDPGDLSCVVGEWRETLSQVPRAVTAAKRAFAKWSEASQKNREVPIKKLQKIYRRRKKELARCISREMGKPLTEALGEVDGAIAKITVTLKAGMSLVQTTKAQGSKQYYRYRPRGVLAVLGPFNFPLHLPNGNFIAALATGNTLIFKPSEITPFTGQLIAECFHEAGFPKGVFNLVQGGGDMGNALVTHPEVDGVLFIGSDATGEQILKKIGESPGKFAALEMGGKNASIVFPDVSLKDAVTACLHGAFATTGQRCNSLSRLMVHQSILEEFVELLVRGSKKIHIAYGLEPQSQMGPLATEAAVKKFFRYQKMAKRDRAQEVLGAKKLSLDREGYYVSPSIHLINKHRAKKSQKGYYYDEIFGPDVVVLPFRDLEEAVALVNDSRYGLAASVFSKKKAHFTACLKSLEVGNLYWNQPTAGALATLPFGGIKASGNYTPAGLFTPFYCTYPQSIRE